MKSAGQTVIENETKFGNEAPSHGRAAIRSAWERPKGERSTPSVDASTVEAFARAIVKPGGDALLIDSDNESLGLVEIAETQGRVFAVDVAEDIFAVDFDGASMHVIHDLRTELAAWNIHHIFLESGRDGHYHVFARVSDPNRLRELQCRWGSRRKEGVDIRRWIRPPLSPHRSGLAPRLISPETPEEALRVLRRPSTDSVVEMPRLADEIDEVLRLGTSAVRTYRSRSEMLMALTVARVNARFSKESIWRLLIDPKNRGGEKLQEMRQRSGERAARRYFGHGYDRALDFVRSSPAFRDRSEAMAALANIERAASRHHWRGRARKTDRVVLIAHLNLASRLGSLSYGFSAREIADAAGVSAATAWRSSARLVKDGWINRPRRDQRHDGEAAKWKLIGRPSVLTETIPTHRGCEEGCFTKDTDLAADAFRSLGGLGKAKQVIWESLSQPQTAKELKGRFQYRQSKSVYIHLKVLRRWGLVDCNAGIWRQLRPDLDGVADLLGVRGAGQRQREQHAREREDFRNRRESERRPLQIIDQTTGEVIDPRKPEPNEMATVVARPINSIPDDDTQFSF